MERILHAMNAIAPDCHFDELKELAQPLSA